MKDFIDKASAYYYSGCPIISDEEFDALLLKSTTTIKWAIR